MTSKRIAEAGTIRVAEDGSFEVCLITEGEGSSANFPRPFFTQPNADALANSMSFPSHPLDLNKPEHRDPLSAIGRIAESVTIQEDAEGMMGMWSRFIPAKSKPQVAEYLAEFGHLLGLSVYADSDGHNDPATGKWVAESLNGSDPYKSVDLVVAAGRGGKFVKVGESLGLITKASTPVEEKEVTHMDKDIEERFTALEATILGKLAEALAGGVTPAPLQGEADQDAVNAAVKVRLTEYQAKVKLIAEAKLSESQVADLSERALNGEDITSALENAKKVAEELRKPSESDEDVITHYVAEHLSGGDNQTKKFDAASMVPGFGKVA